MAKKGSRAQASCRPELPPCREVTASRLGIEKKGQSVNNASCVILDLRSVGCSVSIKRSFAGPSRASAMAGALREAFGT